MEEIATSDQAIHSAETALPIEESAMVAVQQPRLPSITVQPLPVPMLVEAILYAAKEPAAVSAIALTLDITIQDVETALHDLNAAFEQRGVRLQRHGNRVQLITAPEAAEIVQKFLGLEENTRLSSAALETLAIIAYNQPVTKPQIEMIRGVNCDGVMTTLEARNLVQELGRADSVGHPMRYGVSFEFLRHFGLKGIHELPPVENLDVLPKETISDEPEAMRNQEPPAPAQQPTVLPSPAE